MDIWPLASTDDHVLATTSDIEREHEMRKREISLGGLRQVAKQREQSGLIQSQSQCGKLLSNESNPDLKGPMRRESDPASNPGDPSFSPRKRCGGSKIASMACLLQRKLQNNERKYSFATTKIFQKPIGER